MAVTEPLDILADRLTKCLSALKAELESNTSAAYTAVNKRSEVIIRDLMNILYNKNLVLESKCNASAFDLCDQDNMLLVQVTSNHTIGKITDCLRTTTDRVAKEPWLRGFDLNILFLTTDSKTTHKLRGQAEHKLPKLGLDLSSISFDPRADILDFNDLLKMLRENLVTQQQMAQLTDLMDKYWPHICGGSVPVDKVQEVIDLYIENFEAPLFMHRDSKTVTLKNLYVEPSFSGSAHTHSITALFEDFLWKKELDKILLIEGSAAIGKTSLVSWLCYQHAHPTENNNAGQTIFCGRPIVVVRLRELDFPDQQPSASALLQYLQFPDAKVFCEKYADAIMILDGADELGLVSNVSTSAIGDFILDVYLSLSPYKLIITSRPHFLQKNHLHGFHYQFRDVTLEHFNHTKRACWVQRYKDTGETLAPDTEKYILNISDSSADGVADTPLALYLLADCRIKEDYQHNQWALYRAIFSDAILKTPYNAAIPGSGPLMSSEHAAQNYDMVKAIAFRMFRNTGTERFYITKPELDEIAAEVGLTGVDAQRVRETCVLCAYWKDTRTGALEFYHNNIRDFFLAEYWCDQLEQAFSELPPVFTQEIGDSYFECPQWNRLMMKISSMFCWARINGSTWNQVLSFISLRLQAAGRGMDARNQMLSYFMGNPVLYRLVEQFANSPALWTADRDIHPYTGAQNALFNFLSIFQIILRHLPEDAGNRPVLRYTDVGRTLLSHWSDLFVSQTQVTLSDQINPLSNFILEDINWSSKVLNMVEFTKLSLVHVSFICSTLNNPIFSDTSIHNSNFEHAQLIFATSNTSKFCRNSFENSRLRECLIADSVLDECSFERVTFKTIKIGKSTFRKCSMMAASINNATARHVRFDDCRLSGAYFSDSYLEDVVLLNADLIETTFNNSTLVNCRIEGKQTKLKKTAFIGVQTQNCTFHNVSGKNAEILRSLGFTENPTPYERNNDYDSESNSV